MTDATFALIRDHAVSVWAAMWRPGDNDGYIIDKLDRVRSIRKTDADSWFYLVTGFDMENKTKLRSAIRKSINELEEVLEELGGGL